MIGRTGIIIFIVCIIGITASLAAVLRTLRVRRALVCFMIALITLAVALGWVE
jgi:uncharacterized membrane protein